MWSSGHPSCNKRTQRVELAIAQPHSVEQMGRRSVIYGLRAGVIGGLCVVLRGPFLGDYRRRHLPLGCKRSCGSFFGTIIIVLMW